MKMPENKIAREDCLSFLSRMPDGVADLAVIDPPYNMKKAQWDSFASEARFLEFTESWISAFLPKMKASGSFYIFNTPRHCALMLPMLLRRGAELLNWITWDKRDGINGGTRRYSAGQESILFCSAGGRHYFDPEAVREPYLSAGRIEHAKKKGILKNGKRWFPNAKGRLCGDVWHFSSHRHKTKVNGRVVRQNHPTPKPEDMIRRMVLASSRPGDLVLDLFSGTGTTARVCLDTGRRFTGCENDREIFAELSDRIGHAHTQSLP